jgi:hypothetical protein
MPEGKFAPRRAWQCDGPRSGVSSIRRCDRKIDIAIAFLFIVSIAPVLAVDIPAMADYPNHLARMYGLTVAGTPDANPFYEVDMEAVSESCDGHHPDASRAAPWR